MNADEAAHLDRLALAGFGDGRLVPFADSVWTAATPVRFAGSWFPHTMTVIRFAGNRLVLHSPCRPSPALLVAIADIGNVAHVVAPNWFHDLYLSEYRTVYPAAIFWGPGMLQRQRGSTFIDCVLNQDTRAPWSDEMPHFTLCGMLTFNESIFFHTPSRTLIVADLVMNAFAGAGTPMLTRLGYRFFGLDGELITFPILQWFGFTSRRSLRSAAQQIYQWKPERLVVGHGKPIRNDVSMQLHAALQWLGK